MSISNITEDDIIKSIEHDLKWHSKELKPNYKKELKAAIEYLQELKKYHAVGTFEEFRMLKEKSNVCQYNEEEVER